MIKLAFSDEFMWGCAIDQWVNEGRNEPVAALLQGDRPIPADARRWLADALSGRIKRKVGRRAAQDDTVAAVARPMRIREDFEQFRMLEQLAAKEAKAAGKRSRDGDSTVKALQRCADRHNMSVGAIKRVIYPPSTKRRRIGANSAE